MANIRYYKEETRCQNCGRFIRNVIEIDDAQYGTSCAVKFLPKVDVKKIRTHSHDQLIAMQAREDLKILRESLIDYAMATLPNPGNGQKRPFFNTPDDALRGYITNCPNSIYCLGIIALLEARKIKY